MAGNGFDWFTGIASIAARCPPALREIGGLRRFYIDPNSLDWGREVPRLLMHESLHAWQLASSHWLLRLVDEEWLRALALQPGRPPNPAGPLRRAYGRAADGEPFSVRDLVECLARFWDVHIRGPQTLLAEEGDEFGGRLSEIDKRRRGEVHGNYSSIEFEALMAEGREHSAYAAPYRWLIAQAEAADVVLAWGWPGREGASWAANVVLPIAGFVALNADQPVAAFTAAVARLLRPDAIGVAVTKRHPVFRSINVDWLIFWPVLRPSVVRALRCDGHRIAEAGAVLDVTGLAAHPV